MVNRNTLRALLGLALLAAIGMAVAWRDRLDIAAMQTWVEGAGVAAPLVFIAGYAAATVLFLPGAVIALAGGALFGPVWGTLWNLAGATPGARPSAAARERCAPSSSRWHCSPP